MFGEGDQRCAGVTGAGTRCKIDATADSIYCGLHKGKWPEDAPPEPFEVPAPKPKEVKTAEWKPGDPLRPYPYREIGGADELAAIRTIKMVKPYCPADPNPEIVMRDGTTRANPRYTGEPNCQLVYRLDRRGLWDVAMCESLGHRPYYSTFRVSLVEETEGPDGYLTDSKVRIRRDERLNIVQVSDNPRHSSGGEVQEELRKGSKYLEDFGYMSPCEYRNCFAPKKVQTSVGQYCSGRHARLVAADLRKILLPVGGDPLTEQDAMQEKERLLDSLNINERAL